MHYIEEETTIDIDKVWIILCVNIDIDYKIPDSCSKREVLKFF